MRAYRLARAKYSAFSGRGSLLVNGRWHWAGAPITYCADSRALAVLETLVHTRKDQMPSDYVFYEIELDDEFVEVISEANLPSDWAAVDPVGSRTFGTAWMHSNRSTALSVPSVVIPQERNLLINPDHPNFSSIRISPPLPFDFDPRLFHIS